MHVAEAIALGFIYPTPSSVAALTEATESATRGPVQRKLRQFIAEIQELSLGAWEELHTATLDLSPPFVPYVGHVQWGDNYKRGELMATLKGEMTAAGIDLRGELPDHIEPILRYLAVVTDPNEELVEILRPTVETMSTTLQDAAPTNPYRHLIEAVELYTADLHPLTIGRSK